MNMDTWLLDIMNSTNQSECWSNPSGKLDQHQDIGHDSDYKIVTGPMWRAGTRVDVEQVAGLRVASLWPGHHPAHGI